jgi:hypothetical protein
MVGVGWLVGWLVGSLCSHKYSKLFIQIYIYIYVVYIYINVCFMCIYIYVVVTVVTQEAVCHRCCEGIWRIRYVYAIGVEKNIYIFISIYICLVVLYLQESIGLIRVIFLRTICTTLVHYHMGNESQNGGIKFTNATNALSCM